MTHVQEAIMEMKSVAASVILAVGIAGGAALLGSQLSDGIESFVNRDRIVTVKGRTRC